MIRPASHQGDGSSTDYTSSRIPILHLKYIYRGGDVRPRRNTRHNMARFVFYYYYTTNTQIRETQYHLEPTRFFVFLFIFMLRAWLLDSTLTSFDVARG